MATQVALCSSTQQLLRLEVSRSASFDAMPPPSEWTPAWLHHLQTMHPDKYCLYARSGIGCMEALLGRLARGDSSAQAALDEAWSKFTEGVRYVLGSNPTAVLANLNRNVETGKYEETGDWWPELVARVQPLRRMRPCSLPKLLASYQLYEDTLRNCQAERQVLQQELAALHSAQGISCSLQGSNAGTQHVSCSSGSSCHPASLVTLLATVPAGDSLAWTGADGTHAPAGPILHVHVDAVTALDALLAQLEAVQRRELHARVQLMRFACSELLGSATGALLVVASRPYVLTLPAVLRCMVEQLQQPGALDALSLQAPWVLRLELAEGEGSHTPPQ